MGDGKDIVCRVGKCVSVGCWAEAGHRQAAAVLEQLSSLLSFGNDQEGGREDGFYAAGSLSSSNSSVMEQGLISVTNVGEAL